MLLRREIREVYFHVSCFIASKLGEGGCEKGESCLT